MNINIESHRIHFQNIIVSLLELRVWLGKREIHFTLSELRLLLHFLEDPYKTVSPEEMMQRVGLTSLKNLYPLINRVRVLLERQYIVTQRCGYSFVESPRDQERRLHDLQAN